jgi:hypothetical protein
MTHPLYRPHLAALLARCTSNSQGAKVVLTQDEIDSVGGWVQVCAITEDGEEATEITLIKIKGRTDG